MAEYEFESEEATPQALWQDRPPPRQVKKERVWHRLAALLAAQGLTVREIARRLDRTPEWVSEVLRQPHTRQFILDEIKRASADELKNLLRAAATDSIFKLIELRDTAKSETVQLNAAVQLVNRWLGAPTQRVEWHEVPLDEELRRIDAELREMEETCPSKSDIPVAE